MLIHFPLLQPHKNYHIVNALRSQLGFLNISNYARSACTIKFR